MSTRGARVLVPLALALVLGILGMHALAGGHAGMSGMSGMSGMPGPPGTPGDPETAATAAAGAPRAVVHGVDGGLLGPHGAALMLCGLMLAGGLVVAVARRRGAGRLLPAGAARLLAAARPVGRWSAPATGPPPPSWRFSVVRC